MINEKKTKIGSVNINYAEGPQAGSKIVLLHGLPGRWRELMPILPALIFDWHRMALDFRRQGKSVRIPVQYQYKYYVAGVAQFLQQQLNKPVIILSHSKDCVVALNVAAQLPKFLRGVIVDDFSPVDRKATQLQTPYSCCQSQRANNLVVLQHD